MVRRAEEGPYSQFLLDQVTSEGRFWVGLFGAKKMGAAQLMFVGLQVFTRASVAGLALGAAAPTNIELSLKLAGIQLSKESPYGSLAEYAAALVRDQLRRSEGEPQTYLEYWFEVHYPALDPAKAGLETLRAFQREQRTYSNALSQCAFHTFEGLAFGILQPNIVRTMFRGMYETPLEPQRYQAARDAGVGLPEHQEIVRFEEFQMDVLRDLAGFLSGLPDTVAALGLASLLPKG